MNKMGKRKRTGKYERIGIVCEVCDFDYSSVVVRHHILPIALKGSNEPSNLVWLCPNCHAVIHHLKKLMGRDFLSGNQITRAHFSKYTAARNTARLLRHYSENQVEILWQIAEELFHK